MDAIFNLTVLIESKDMNDSHEKPEKSKPAISFNRTPRPIRLLREIIAIFLWVIVLIQALVFDVIGSLSQATGIPTWIDTYRSLILLGTVILLWLFLGNKRFVRFAGYIAIYPIVIICWHIPRLCFKNWPILAILSPAILSFIRSFRFTLAIYGFSFISAFTIFLAEDKELILPASLIIGFMLLVHYYRQLKTVFASKTVFARTADAIGGMWEKVKTDNTFVLPDNIDPSTEEGEKQFLNSLIPMYILTAGLERVVGGMRSVAESRKLDLFFLLSWCATVCLTVFVFAFLYLGVEKVSPGSFENAAGFVSFLGYSLCVLTTSDLSYIKPLSDTARIVSFLELCGSISVLILMVFLILTSLRDRYRDDFSRVANELETTMEKFENLMKENFKLTLQAADEKLLLCSHDLDANII
ncbi:MAG: hypothetical protein K9K37_04195 [Desulfocapsa sp.]|nr:hypothetical protein [Desulfocapsa sp.]